MKVSMNFKIYSIFLALSILFCFGFFRSFVRIQTTLIGYDLGKLKHTEAKLLEERSQLQMELAKLTSKDQLLTMAKGSPSNYSIGSVASHRGFLEAK